MIPDEVAQGVLAMLSGGTIAAVLSWLAARKRLPIERDSAHAAASREITQAATELMAPLRAEVERLDHEVQELRRESAEHRRRADIAEAKIAAAEAKAAALAKISTEADDYITALHRDWPQVRREDRPPAWRWLDDAAP